MKKYTILLAFSLLLSFGTLFAQFPEAFNYQGIARDAGGNPVASQAIGLRISIVEGTANGTVIYQETHAPTTNDYGLFNVLIGEGTPTNGQFNQIDWAGNIHFASVEIDPAGGSSYTLAGTNKLVSVPYAMVAKTVDDVDDADADPANELQVLSTNGDTLFLSQGGGSVIMGDADPSPTNELQTLSQSGSTVSLSSGGGSVSIDDADASATNEIQTLAISGQTLSISGANQVTLPADADWTVNGTDIYNNNANVQVGIGTASPAYPLHIYPGNVSRGFELNHDKTASGTTYSLFVDVDNTYTGVATTYGVYSDVYKNGGGGSVYGAYIAGRNYSTSGSSANAYGAYLWGYRSTTTPSATTYGIYATQSGSAATEYAGYFSGNVYCTGSYLPSDRNLKRNISAYNGALNSLMQLGTYTYEYDTEKYVHMALPEGRQIGLIAQDVKGIYPHLTMDVVQPPTICPVEDAKDWVGEGNYVVGEDGMAHVGQETNFTSVNYAGLVPVLVQSIKEQQQTIDNLNDKLQKMEQRLQQLENK